MKLSGLLMILLVNDILLGGGHGQGASLRKNIIVLNDEAVMELAEAWVLLDAAELEKGNLMVVEFNPGDGSVVQITPEEFMEMAALAYHYVNGATFTWRPNHGVYDIAMYGDSGSTLSKTIRIINYGTHPKNVTIWKNWGNFTAQVTCKPCSQAGSNYTIPPGETLTMSLSGVFPSGYSRYYPGTLSISGMTHINYQTSFQSFFWICMTRTGTNLCRN